MKGVTLLAPLPDGRTPTALIFDFDGTICDSAPGVFVSLNAAFRELGLPELPDEELREWIGPPTQVSFRERLGMDPEAAEAARQVFRRHYDELGMELSRPFPEVPELILELSGRGVPLGIATSKPEFAARALLEGYGLADSFQVISGASADEKLSSKAYVLGRALEGLQARDADVSLPVLIGDRIHDVEGGLEHGVGTIAVAWGYGREEEWADALARVATPAELRALLLG